MKRMLPKKSKVFFRMIHSFLKVNYIVGTQDKIIREGVFYGES
jgi:hypothetical protein